MQHRSLYLVCTGLGNIQRGFEQHIYQLAFKLFDSVELAVLGGGPLAITAFEYKRILNISRKSLICRALFSSSDNRFMLEQLTFFIGMLPLLFRKKPSVFYLGEYKLYCYLFKLRSLFNLNYSLVLYTGGQAAPGLFDHTKDFVHHVTNVYLPYTRKLGIPANREFIIPHYVDCTFTIDSAQVAKIRSLAGGKSIFLSVGIIDCSIKRMDLIPELLGELKKDVFVILLGRQTDETHLVLKQFEKLMPGQFICTEIPHKEIGNYYAAADYLIQCSKRESFGYMYVEALSCDLTVITHDFEEARYVLEDYAFFVDMNNTEAASKTIIDLLSRKKKIAGAKYVADKYSWDSLRNYYIRMFDAFIE